MLMGLCPLVYTHATTPNTPASFTKNHNQESKNQLGKLTERPTLRWSFQCFQIHVLLLVGYQPHGERL